MLRKPVILLHKYLQVFIALSGSLFIIDSCKVSNKLQQNCNNNLDEYLKKSQWEIRSIIKNDSIVFNKKTDNIIIIFSDEKIIYQ